MLRTLTFSTLFPNLAQPRHGIFVEERLRHLVTSGQVATRVVAPVPWFPFGHPLFGSYARFARVPRREQRYGIEVSHPRYPLLPSVGMTLTPAFMTAAVQGTVRRELKRVEFDLIDAHYLYPDGVAAVSIGARLGVPVVVTARGTDVNLIPNFRLPRRMIVRAACRAAHVITVCQALKDRLVALGVPAEHVTVLRNGVDLERFRPADREAARSHLGLKGAVLLSVGHLIPRKGHHLAIAALRSLPGTTLVIVGDGPMAGELRTQANALGVSDRVHFAGARTQAELLDYYNAADALVLASDREGMANVLLESMACGTPVVATALWGTPEVVDAPEAGVLMRERSVDALVNACRDLFERYPGRWATRHHAERFGWAHTTCGQLELFEKIVATGRKAPRIGQVRMSGGMET
jgi:teichuronic acid biosynthesis glycosyltransferase TuaC